MRALYPIDYALGRNAGCHACHTINGITHFLALGSLCFPENIRKFLSGNEVTPPHALVTHHRFPSIEANNPLIT